MHNDPKKQGHYVEGMLMALANRRQTEWIEGAQAVTQTATKTQAPETPGSLNLTNLTQRCDVK